MRSSIRSSNDRRVTTAALTNIKNQGGISSSEQGRLQNIQEANRIIDFYNALSVKEWNDEGETEYLRANKMILSARDILLRQPFTLTTRGQSFLETNQESWREEQQVNAYLSTPKFIKYLTDLSIKISDLDDRKLAVEDGILKLNQSLPSTIYIPFTNCKSKLNL